jgi:hypothetical protein
MQFSLRTLFLVMLVVALVCGFFVAAPLALVGMVLAIVLWTCPAFWITAVVYSRGRWRPFFIGGMAAGLAPYLAVVFWSFPLTVEVLGDVMDDFPPSLADSDLLAIEPMVNIALTTIVLLPGFASLMGGLIALAVYRTFRSAEEELTEARIRKLSAERDTQTTDVSWKR